MKHSAKVALQPVKGSDLHPVRLRVAWSGCRADLSLGVSYNSEKWIKEIGRARPNTRNSLKQSATEVNGLIEDAVRWVDSYFVKAAAVGTAVSAKDLKSAFGSEFRGKGGGVNPGDLLSLFDRFFLESARVRGWSDNTCKKYSSVRGVLARYGIKAADYNEEFFNTYVGDGIKKGLKNTSIAKNVVLLKSFGRWLYDNGFIKEDLSRFSVRLKWSGGNKKAVVYLEWSEVSALEAAVGSLSGSEVAAVDMFLFSCFTGLRFSDVRGLRVSDVKNGKIYIVTKKTTDALEIELNHHSRRIFDKYKAFCADDHPFLFPSISIQIANRNLKAVFSRLGLCRFVKKISFSGSERSEAVVPLCDAVSFHAGRRTFVVECLRRGISPTVIIKWTGHSDYAAMKPYIEIVDSLKASEMAKFDA